MLQAEEDRKHCLHTESTLVPYIELLNRTSRTYGFLTVVLVAWQAAEEGFQSSTRDLVVCI